MRQDHADVPVLAEADLVAEGLVAQLTRVRTLSVVGPPSRKPCQDFSSCPIVEHLKNGGCDCGSSVSKAP